MGSHRKCIISHITFLTKSLPAFENRHTVAGVDDQSWSIQFEEAMLEPQRDVLDLNPGGAICDGK